MTAANALPLLRTDLPSRHSSGLLLPARQGRITGATGKTITLQGLIVIRHRYPNNGEAISDACQG